MRKYLQNTFDKRLVFKIYKELLKVNYQRTKDQIFEWAKDLKRQVTKEEIQMAKKAREKMLNISRPLQEHCKVKLDTYCGQEAGTKC